MKNLLLSLILLLLVTCASPHQIPPPPGVERGSLWGEEYGYTDIYTTPDLLPSPKKGTRHLFSELNNVLYKNPCKNKKRLMLRLLINEKGEVFEVMPVRPTGELCERLAAQALKKIEFFPAEYEDKSVKSIISFSAVMP